MAATWCFPAMKMNLRRWLFCKGMVFVCVIWSFDDMGLGKQVILSDKKSKGRQWAMNILNNQIGSIYDRQKNLYSKYPHYSQQNAESKKVCEQEKITATSGKDVLGITKGDKENSYIVHFSDSAMVSRAVARGSDIREILAYNRTQHKDIMSELNVQFVIADGTIQIN